MTTQFVVDDVGNRVAVLLDIDTYNALIEAVEDAEDVAWARDYEARKAAGVLTEDEQETIPIEEVIAEVQGQQTI